MSKTAKAALWIMFATMLSKILGFCREIVLAKFYGTGDVADVFLLTLNIPGLIIAVVGSAIATAYVPIYFKTKEKLGEEGSLKFTNNILNIVLIISLIISIFGLLFTDVLVKVFAVGYEGAKFELAVSFTKIMISGAVFLIVSKLLTLYLQVNENFTIPGLIGIPYNIFIIACIAISTKTDVRVIAIGGLLGMMSQMLFQIPFAKGKKYKYKPYINIKDEYIKEAIILMLPMFIGVAIGQLNMFVDRALATTLGKGALSSLNYATRLNEFVNSLFVLSIVTVIYPKLAQISNSEDKKGFVNTIVKATNVIVLLVLPITVGAIVLAEPIIRILFERGQFNEESTIMTSSALRLYSLGLVAIGVREILTRVFYSLSDTKTPMINGSISLVINVILNLMLIKVLGYKGLAISTSIASILTVILLFRSLKKKQGYFGADKIIKTGAKSFVAAIIMGFVSLNLYNYIYGIIGTGRMYEIISLALAVIVGAIIYGILIIIFKVEEINLAFDMVKKLKTKIIKR